MVTFLDNYVIYWLILLKTAFEMQQNATKVFETQIA